MKVRRSLFGVGVLAVMSLAVSASAATSLSYPFTSPIGVSTLPVTQATLSAAGLQFTTTEGLNVALTADPTVELLGDGAEFGNLFSGDGGRNYIRTNDSDYASASFVAEITFTLTNTDGFGQVPAIFFGMGSAEIALWGTPDWSTQVSSASFWIDANLGGFQRFETKNDVNSFTTTTVTGGTLYPGTHRFRMTYNAATKMLLGEIDRDYVSGPFVADAVTNNAPIDVTSLFAADGWPSEPSRIFFGGDDGATFRDLSITVVPEPTAGVLFLITSTAAFGARRRRG